jgi:hypothetical protein
MRIGLIIQGPSVSYGQFTGPNRTPHGFDARDTILHNLANFSSQVCQVIVSTWEDSGIDLRHHDNVILLENCVPTERDIDNRRKQFISTYEGVKWLANNTDATHVIKIRTDQIVDPFILTWLESFYCKYGSLFDASKTRQKSFLVFSEYIDNSLFYVGDFIFAGTIEDVLSFCRYNLSYGVRNLHPAINADFVIKHLSRSDKLFQRVFFPMVPYLWQTSNTSDAVVGNYWTDVRQTRFSFIPRSIFGNIIWKGRRMADVIPSYESCFRFYEDWCRSGVPIMAENPSKNLGRLLPNRTSFRMVAYEYGQYVRKWLGYYVRGVKTRK